MTPEQRIDSLLRRAGGRLAFGAGIRRGGWFALAALLSVEVGVAVPLLDTPAFALAVLFLGAGVAVLSLTPRPGSLLVAEVLDARLARGAVLASAAEALEGRHPGFRPLVIAAADTATRDLSIVRLLPLRPPPALLLALAAALFLPFLLPDRASARAESVAEAPTSLLDPTALAAGGALPPNAEPRVTAPDDEVPTVVEGIDPVEAFDALPLPVAEEVRKRIAELLADLPEGATSGGATSAAGSEADPLTDALASGDAARILRELEEAAVAARKGDSAAALKLRSLGEAAAPGEGASDAQPTPVEGGGGTGSLTTGGQGRRLPWFLGEACRRYFSAG